MINHGNLPPPPPNPMLVNPRMPAGGYRHNIPPVNTQMMQPSPMIPHPAPVHQAPMPMPAYQVPVVGPAVYPVNPSGSAIPSITPAEQKEWESAYTHGDGDTEKKKTKEKKFVRVAGSQVWEDASLNTWDPSMKISLTIHHYKSVLFDDFFPYFQMTSGYFVEILVMKSQMKS